MKTQWKIFVLLAMSAGFVGFAACSGGGGGGEGSGSVSDGKGNTVSAGAKVECFTAPRTCQDGKLATSTGNKDCPYQCGSGAINVRTQDGSTGTASATN